MSIYYTNIETGINLQPQDTNAPSVDGDLRYNSATNNLELFDGTVDVIATANNTVTFTNKSISGSDNTLTNIPASAFTGVLPIANGGTGESSFSAGALSSNGTTLTSGTLSVADGGTGQVTQQAAINALAGAVTAGTFLRGDGTNDTMSSIQVSDVPTLNQNTTGTAANITATSNSTLTSLPDLSLPLSQTTGVLPIANGGTDNGSLGVTAGGVIYTDGTRLQNSGAGASGQVLTSGGTGSPTWTSSLTNPMTSPGDMIVGGTAGASSRLPAGTSGEVVISSGTSAAFGSLPGNQTVFKAPTVTQHGITGTQTGWVFDLGIAATAAVGDTYKDNTTGSIFTIQIALTGSGTGFILWVSGTGASTSTTLARQTGSGSATLSVSAKIATSLYTIPSGPTPLYIRVRAVGGGGGGGGTGSAVANGTAGNFTALGNYVICGGGGAGGGGTSAGAGAPGVGGTPSIGFFTGLTFVTTSFGGGGSGGQVANQLTGTPAGGSSYFAGAGAGAAFQSNGGSGINTSGGGGAGGAPNNADYSGAGGGAGSYCEAFITSAFPGYAGGFTIPYVVAASASGGVGTSTSGGNGAGGQIIFEEMYQ